MKQNVILRESFGKDAEGYDRHRPGYPIQLFDFIKARLPANGSMLEIGCGSGKATVALSSLANSLIAIDISADLLNVARKNCSSCQNITFICDQFESFDAQGSAFDSIVSAQAIHWVDADIGYPKINKLLRTNGLLACFWNFALLDRTAVTHSLKNVILEHAPIFSKWTESSSDEVMKHGSQFAQVINARTSYFASIEYFDWELDWNSHVFLNWLGTKSWWKTLSEDAKAHIRADVCCLSPPSSTFKMPFTTSLVYALNNKPNR